MAALSRGTAPTLVPSRHGPRRPIDELLPWSPSLDCSGFCGGIEGTSVRPGSLSSWAFDALESISRARGGAKKEGSNSAKRKRDDEDDDAEEGKQGNTMKTRPSSSQPPPSASASAATATAARGLALLESLAAAASAALPPSLTAEQAESLHAFASASLSSSSSGLPPPLTDAALLLVCSSPLVLSAESLGHAAARALLSAVLSPALEAGEGVEGAEGGERRNPLPPPPLSHAAAAAVLAAAEGHPQAVVDACLGPMLRKRRSLTNRQADLLTRVVRAAGGGGNGNNGSNGGDASTQLSTKRNPRLLRALLLSAAEAGGESRGASQGRRDPAWGESAVGVVQALLEEGSKKPPPPPPAPCSSPAALSASSSPSASLPTLLDEPLLTALAKGAAAAASFPASGAKLAASPRFGRLLLTLARARVSSAENHSAAAACSVSASASASSSSSCLRPSAARVAALTSAAAGAAPFSRRAVAAALDR